VHAVLVIFVLVLISFGLIYYCKLWALRIAQKYPTVDPQAIASSYGDELEYYAFLEYNNYYIKDEDGKITENKDYFMVGPLLSFCL